MFYLKEFFKIFEDSPFKGASFVFLTSLLAISLTHREWINHLVVQITPEKMVHPYFVAFLEGSSNLTQLQNVMKEFPGIISVQKRDSSESKLKIMKLVSKLGKGYGLDEKLMNHHSLKITLNPSLSRESLEFVRSQMIKLGKKNNLNASDIKYPELTKEMQAHPFYQFIEKAGDWGLIFILTFFWAVSYLLCYPYFRSRSYLIEKFQRKKNVSSKILSTGMGLILILFGAFGIWNGTLKILDLGVLIALFVTAWSFMLLDWRWNSRL